MTCTDVYILIVVESILTYLLIGIGIAIVIAKLNHLAGKKEGMEP